jgi:serine/threonine-protein kinase HipA
MAIGGRSVADTIQLKHWLTLVPDTRAAQRLLVRDMTELAGRIGDEADKLLAEFEDAGITHEILKTVRGVIETRATHLLMITEKPSVL